MGSIAEAMAIDRNDASSMLQDIAGIERRTREAITYGSASTIMVVWGVLVFAGYLINWLTPRVATPTWLTIMVAGVGATFWIRFINRRARGAIQDHRISYAQIILIGFGFVWTIVMGRYDDDRIMGTFWPTLFMFGYTVMGLWLGRFFTIVGIAVTAAILVGFLWLGSWFHLWMACVMGGAFIGGGLWMRRLRTLL